MTTPSKANHPLMEFFIEVKSDKMRTLIRQALSLGFLVMETRIVSKRMKKGVPIEVQVMRITTKELQALWEDKGLRFTAYQLLADQKRIRKLSKRTFRSQLCKPKGKRVVVDLRPFTRE